MGMWSRVERGIVLARRPVNFLRIGGQFIIKTIEIDALAARNQPFFVRPTEIKVPKQRALLDLFPIANSGQGERRSPPIW